MRKKNTYIAMILFYLSPIIGILLSNFYVLFYDITNFMKDFICAVSIFVSILSSLVFYISFVLKEPKGPNDSKEKQ